MEMAACVVLLDAIALKVQVCAFFSNLASILWSWCWGGEDQAGQEEAGEESLNTSGQQNNLRLLVGDFQHDRKNGGVKKQPEASSLFCVEFPSKVSS